VKRLTAVKLNLALAIDGSTSVQRVAATLRWPI
jgi:hypothetical protein